MRTLHFEELASHHTLLLDAGSAVDFLDPDITTYLRGNIRHLPAHFQSIVNGTARTRVSDRQFHRILRDTVSSSLSLQSALLFLERLVCYDVIAIDRHALTSRGVDQSVDIPGVFGVDIPDVAYAKASTVVAAIRRTPQLHEMAQLFSQHHFHGGDKNHADALWSAPGPSLGVPANSEDSLERAVFYLEASTSAGVPVGISPEKRHFLERLGHTVREELRAHIENIVSSKIQSAVRRELSSALWPTTFSIPPLASLILRLASHEHATLFRAALQLRDEPDAKAYRRLLFELQREIRTEAGAVRASSIIREIEHVASDWGRTLDPRHRIDHVNRKAEFAKIPRIGWLFAALGIEEKEYKDPILSSVPAYLMFVARWYS